MARSLHLQSVTLERFKAAFKPDPVSLQPFNVIIGRNGSGKSTLLEALQWLDTTLRRDAREACDRYSGSQDLMNLRSNSQPPHFKIGLEWCFIGGAPCWKYAVTVEDRDGVPHVSAEHLSSIDSAHRIQYSLIDTRERRRLLGLNAKRPGAASFEARDPDRLALGRLGDLAPEATQGEPGGITEFFRNAVFLRLSPQRLAAGSPAKRRSFDPILDEEGAMLPAMLNEMNDEERAALVETIREILPDFYDVEVSKPPPGRDTHVHYSLLEQMPYKGRSGRKRFPIPAWMLSEGTRRITAILALLTRQTPPSLLCIEEIENGLDPWTVRRVLDQLQSAADRGVQVVLTTHSPWLLDEVPIESIIEVKRTEGDTHYMRFSQRPEIQAYDPRIPAGTRYVNEAR